MYRDRRHDRSQVKRGHGWCLMLQVMYAQLIPPFQCSAEVFLSMEVMLKSESPSFVPFS